MSEQNPALAAFLRAQCNQLDASMKKIKHCTSQLNEQQVWWRPKEEMNSIANLLLHLSGNVRQWLICGISGIPDHRERQREFDDRSGISTVDLLAQLSATVEEAKERISALTDSTTVQLRKVQEWEIDGAQAIVDSVAHFQGHTQEIIHLTRIQLGNRYRLEFVPEA